MPDVRDALERAAAVPAAGPDTDRILGRARTLGRRRKALWAGVPAALLLVGLLAVPGLGPRPSVVFGPGGGDLDTLPVPAEGDASAKVLRDGTPVFVVAHEDGQVSVVEAFDPHRLWGMRQLVSWCPSAGWFEGFRTGSRFSPQGAWLGGPAPEGLATYEATVNGRQVEVGERRPGGPRQEVDFRPAGPSCEGEPITLLSHQPWERLTPEEAAVSGRHGWVLVEGVLVHEEADMPRLCAWETTPPRCPADAPVAHGVEAGAPESPWQAIDATFLVRFANGDAAEIVLGHDATVWPEEDAGQDRRFGFIHELEQRDGSVWMEFEESRWITDPAAPNDYRIERSQEVGLIRVSDNVEVYGDIRLNRTGPGLVRMTLETLLAEPELDTIPFWVTVESGTRTVVRIEEQYTP